MGAHHTDRTRSRIDIGGGPSVLSVVGEHRADPTQLLLLGDDGRYYTFSNESDTPIIVELTADWIVDIATAA